MSRAIYQKAAKQEVRGGGDFFAGPDTGKCVVTSLEMFQSDATPPTFACRVIILESSNGKEKNPPGSSRVQICSVSNSDIKKRGPALADMKKTICAIAGLNAETVADPEFIAACEKWINDKCDKGNKPNELAVGTVLAYESWTKNRDGKAPLTLVRFDNVPQTDEQRAEMRRQLAARELDSEE